jgi:uncharacterized repeat protein (TIGR03806 family)
MFTILFRPKPALRSWFARYRPLAFMVGLGSLTSTLIAQPYGLDQRPVVGAFLNNSLPRSVVNNAQGWEVVIAFPNLTFDDPVTLIAEPRTNRLYVTGRQGTIHFFENNPATSTKTLFLDLTPVTQGYDDCGLMGFAFHPEFRVPGSPNRGYVYVYYQFSPNPTSGPSRPPSATPGYNRLSRFTVPDGSLVANPASELVLINQYDRHVWHNGGAMFFGPDGFLYLSNGDEGASNDSYNQTQEINASLFSGVIRIDVDMDPTRSHPIRRQPLSPATPPSGWPPTYTGNYYIPNDNPWQDPGGSVLEEFYAIGLRSPHRMTFDPATGRIWLGDVGQGSREEVNIIEKGGNYQWAYREGTIAGPKSKPNPLIGVDKPPVHDYSRTFGNCVIGGYVYRGSEHPSLFGRYIFGDNGSGRLWALDYDGVNPATVTQLTTMPSGANYSGLSSFGVDQNNELFMLKMGRPSRIYKLARTGTPPPPPPALLSQTGAFTNLATLTPGSALVPFDVNAPLWSDGADKFRWMAIPNDGAPYGSTETIGFTSDGTWSFPVGTVLVKHFELGLNETNSAIRKRLETRFLVHATNSAWYGLTYKWRDDQLEADLLPSSFEETLLVTTPTGIRTQVWYYPSRADCLTCHNANADTVLGVRTPQLNGDFTYPATGRTDNQLRTLNQLGFFNPAINEAGIPNLPKSAPLTDAGAPLEHRIRSYLDANCAHCHRPDGVNALFDARLSTPLEAQGLINGPVANPMGLVNAKIVSPQNLSQSLLHVRDSLEGPGQMPPLARNEVDQLYINLLSQWINSFIPPGAPPAPWLTQDVGPVGLAGATTYTNGTFTLTASGVDIWDAEDSFRFVYQPWEGDVTITARVLSLANTDPWAIGGVMIRQTLTGGSRHAIAALTPQNGFSFTRRLTDGALSAYTGAAATVPYWVRLARTGNTFTASRSTNGVNWTVVGTDTIAMTGPVHVGLAWSAHANNTLGTATFGNVTVVGPPTNQPPTITAIENQTMDEDTVAGPIEFTIGDVETAASELVLSVASTNTALLPTNNIVLGGADGNRTVTMTPTANQFGVSEVTLTVGDGEAEATSTFLLTVSPVNDPPTITAIENQTIDEDTVAGPIEFVIGDMETAAIGLVLSVASTNTALLPTNNIVLGGADENRTVTLTPAPDQFGVTAVTITASDGELEATSTFLLTVAPVNDLPTISAIEDQATDEDTVAGPIEFTIGDVETTASELVLSVVSTNTVLLPTNTVVFGGADGNRTVTLTPAPDQFGVTKVTLTVSDGEAEATSTFLLTVAPVNDLPSISAIENQAIDEDTVAGPIAFMIGDVETPAGELVLSVASTNAALLPTNNIVLGGADGNRTFTLTPAPNQFGVTEVALTVSDGEAEATSTFLLTVSPVNDLPTISAVENQTIDEDTVAGPIEFMIGDVETAASELVLSAVSTNTALLPANTVVFGGEGGNRTVTLTPTANQFGVTEVVLTVSDGEAGATSTFVLTVSPVNDPPVAGPDTITRWASQGVSVAAATLLGNDSDVEGDQLTLISVGPAALPGATVILTNDWIHYGPPPGSFAADEFSYEVSDGWGGLSVGLVTVQVQTEPPAFERLSIEFASADTLRLQLQGTPGWIYTLQTAEVVDALEWQPAGVVEADANGEATLVLPWSPEHTTKLYRAVRGRVP